MKKVKIMLLSLALFAVVGGTLAFKARFLNDWCIAPKYGNGFNCTTSFMGNTFTTHCTDRGGYQNAGSIFSCTSLPDPTLGCDAECPAFNVVQKDN